MKGAEMDHVICLIRQQYLDGGTRGVLRLPGDWTCYTIEPPWRDNGVGVSCIPEGQYQLAMRASPVVERTTGGEFERGWEVQNVPQRSYIMFHPGNNANDTEGCICPGNGTGIYQDLPAVWSSRDTYRELAERLSQRSGWVFQIRSACGVELPK